MPGSARPILRQPCPNLALRGVACELLKNGKVAGRTQVEHSHTSLRSRPTARHAEPCG
jgi:hypothetical protein